MSMENKVSVEMFALDKIVAGDNARLEFDPEGLKELAESLRDTGGVLQPLLGVLDGDGGSVQLIAGERRLRAAKMAGLSQVEVKLVDCPSRELWLKWNLVENLQRENLRPLELARRVVEMLELEDEGSGQRAWSMSSLAEELGKDLKFVVNCIYVVRAPVGVLEALERGEVGMETVALIGSLPAAVRDRAADEVVFRAFGGAMDRDTARRYVAENFRRDLRRAGFDGLLEDLVPDAGPCQQCEWWGGNRDDVAGRARGSVCLNPACYNAKSAAHRRLRCGVLEEENVTVLDEVAAGRVFEGHSDAVAAACDYVDLEASPDGYLLVDPRAAVAPWKELMAGVDDAPVVVSFDGGGRERRLMEVVVAVDAVCRAGGGEIFKSGATDGLLSVQDRAEIAAAGKRADAEREKVLVEGCVELLGLLSDSEGWEMEWISCLIDQVMGMGLRKEDVVFLCRVLDPSLGRVGKPWDVLDDLLTERVLSKASAMGFLALAINVRSLRLLGFGEWTDEESPMWVLCSLAGFSPAMWAAGDKSE